MKIAPLGYSELYRRVTAHIGPDRAPTLIGFDGKGAAGKSSAATWLAWQLGIPSLHLDLYLSRPVDQGPIDWRVDDLNRCVDSRGDHRCLIIEGVLLLDALTKIQSRKLGYLVFVENEPLPSPHTMSLESRVIDPREFALENQVERYFERANPKARADLVLSWREPT